MGELPEELQRITPMDIRLTSNEFIALVRITENSQFNPDAPWEVSILLADFNLLDIDQDILITKLTNANGTPYLAWVFQRMIEEREIRNDLNDFFSGSGS